MGVDPRACRGFSAGSEHLLDAGVVVDPVAAAGVLHLVDVADAGRLVSRPLLLPGPRVAAVARRLDWRGPIVQAATAEDDAMLQALERFAATGPAPPA